jgi:hypothetical protein
MSLVMLALLLLAALSLGLRTTTYIGETMHPVMRLVLALLIGIVLTMAFLELCRNNELFELGLGLLVSLSPVGLFDGAKWWFAWAAESQGGRTRG